jgi:hypothetical protein
MLLDTRNGNIFGIGVGISLVFEMYRHFRFQGTHIQSRRSISKVKRSWYEMENIARRNTHVTHESYSTNQSKVMTNFKVLEKEVKLQG